VSLDKYKICLIGDSCIDEYQFGVVDRISPEAPVPVFRYLYSEERPGMVLNVKNNLEKYPIEVDLFTGDPSRKIRVVDNRSKQHLLRIDHDVFVKEPLRSIDNIEQYDAVVVSDYDKGSVNYTLLEYVCNNFTGPIYIDTKKKDLQRFSNSIIKINEQERNQCISTTSEMVVTLGSRGAIYKDKIYKSENVEVSDVCGAGDTFLAALAFWHLTTSRLDLAIPLANKAAAVTVQHFGTYAPSVEEYYDKT
jgi:D-beta-D-heptose 7-phosphate kinase/D-beta-D-heptose 1-phosphate adenosyltransferase